MRLRLSVQRNNLPASNILWNVPDTNSPQAYTIARLLEDVNQVLPLEAEQWGLEDYVVEVNGFECLHFSPVSQTLKDDDLVSIRPLLTAEVRSRTLCGRYQISEDGRHLLDGIPFGRPYLRQPHRPSVRIPPRKRQRLEDDVGIRAEATDVAGLITENGGPFLQTNGGSHDDPIHDEEEESDEEYVVKHDKKRSRSDKGIKQVQFVQAREEESDDSEDDEEFAPSDEDESANASATSSSDTSTASDSDDSSSSNSNSDSDSDSDSSSDDSEDESVNAGSSNNRETPFGKGSKYTKIRNKRRKESRQLRELKRAGEIDLNATLADYRQYKEAHQLVSIQDIIGIPAKAMAAPNGKRKHLEDIEGEVANIDEAAELEARKRKMLAEFEEQTQEEGPLTHTQDDVQMEDSVAEATVARPDTPPEQLSSRKPEPMVERPSKRLRPDTAAIGRMLARQTRTLDKKPAKGKKPVAESPPEPEGINDPDFWKSRVKLSAFECWEEDHELSTPPFPFKQHWDPASQLMREQLKKKKDAKAKKKKHTVVSDSEEEDNEKLILNYDDSPETAKQDSDPTAAIESQLLQDVEVAAHSDLPELPEDVASLPALQMTDIQVGAIVATKLWVIDPKTVTPEITAYKTAIVEKEGDSGHGAGRFRLRLAERDVPKKVEKQVDAEGNKIRSAHNDFHMDGDDEDDEEDPSIWEGSFAELVEPKLVQAAKSEV
ncbi:hypothetical protein CC80DRAFT_447641 [Byssothecium circinans]|uniref:DUF7357 domain-containing protein n=1 Tax=Byssothecium circinans TaxID=147558 RepID=A0A6A5TRK6_9PLEO|nr:hypothetical protein CC80DRAFT_447641 [Byssothecium circinans]